MTSPRANQQEMGAPACAVPRPATCIERGVLAGGVSQFPLSAHLPVAGRRSPGARCSAGAFFQSLSKARDSDGDNARFYNVH